MFETLAQRAAAVAERRTRERIAQMAERMAGELPADIVAEASEEGVRLSGRRLGRRFALEPALRWLIALGAGNERRSG